jgi:Fe-Mn family superoxide dismutase
MEAGNKHFGSGWVWLVSVQQDGDKLQIYTTSGHDYPLKGHYPVLVNDLWEHAYYLNYENRRGNYLRGWWAVVNWDEVARRFEYSDQTAVQDWEDEGGLVLRNTSETLCSI